MLQDGTRIQLDLHAALNIDKIVLGSTPLKYERDSGAVFVDFPETLRAGVSTQSISTIPETRSRRAVWRSCLPQRSFRASVDQHSV